jgi:hypothetical protein
MLGRGFQTVGLVAPQWVQAGKKNQPQEEAQETNQAGENAKGVKLLGLKPVGFVRIGSRSILRVHSSTRSSRGEPLFARDSENR